MVLANLSCSSNRGAKTAIRHALKQLFRTIDRTSQVTIETQYAARDASHPCGEGDARRPRFSFFKRIYEPLVCARALLAPSVFTCARAPDDRRRTIVLYCDWGLAFGLPCCFPQEWARSSVG